MRRCSPLLWFVFWLMQHGLVSWVRKQFKAVHCLLNSVGGKISRISFCITAVGGGDKLFAFSLYSFPGREKYMSTHSMDTCQIVLFSLTVSDDRIKNKLKKATFITGTEVARNSKSLLLRKKWINWKYKYYIILLLHTSFRECCTRSVCPRNIILVFTPRVGEKQCKVEWMMLINTHKA